MITSKELRELGFTLIESDYNSSLYNFPKHLNHGGRKLRLEEWKSDHIVRDQAVSVIDGNGITHPQSITNIDGVEFYLKQFPKK